MSISKWVGVAMVFAAFIIAGKSQAVSAQVLDQIAENKADVSTEFFVMRTFN